MSVGFREPCMQVVAEHFLCSIIHSDGNRTLMGSEVMCLRRLTTQLSYYLSRALLQQCGEARARLLRRTN